MLAFSSGLGVSVDALRCAVPVHDGKQCRKADCTIVALENNWGCCGMCRQEWFPAMRLNSSSSMTSAPPGSLLLGPKFMRGHGNTNKLCCCVQPKCHEIGYANEGMMALPRNESQRQQWFHAMSWRVNANDMGNDLNKSPTKHRIAYWHFKPENRFIDPQSVKWRLNDFLEGRVRKDLSYSDQDGKTWSCIVPDNPLRSFIEVEVRGCGTHPTKKWALGLEPAPLWAPKMKHTLDEASKASQPLKKSKRATSEHACAEALEGQKLKRFGSIDCAAQGPTRGGTGREQGSPGDYY